MTSWLLGQLPDDAFQRAVSDVTRSNFRALHGPLRWLRQLVDTIPVIGRGYRNVRDRRAAARLSRARSPYGFVLWGGNYLAAGLHEDAEVELVARALRDAEVLIDCGANSGLFTCLAAAQRTHVIAIEPSERNLSVLYQNIRENAFEEIIEVYPVALGALPGLAMLYGRGQGASLLAGWGGQPTYDQRTVPVLPLDAIVGRRFDGKRIVLKIDVEGSEWAVLQGAEHTLAQHPAVLMELSFSRNHPSGRNPHYRAIFERFWSLGYRAHPVSGPLVEITPSMIDDWLEASHTTIVGENVWFSYDPS